MAQEYGQHTAPENTDERYIHMTEDPVGRLIGKLAIPSITTMLITAIYNMADTYFVGNIGTSATAAIGVVFSVMALIQAFGFFFGHGSGNYISRQLGAQNMEEAAKMAATGFFSAFFIVAALALLGQVFIEPLALLLGATKTILPYACQYLRFILVGAPFMASSLMLNNLLRFQGNSFLGMIGMTSGGILNMILDPLFIFGLDMGVAGAGAATMISQMVSCSILLICCTKRGSIRISIKNFSPGIHFYKEILRGGTPSLLRQGLASVATISLNQAAGVYGDAVIAAMSIVSRTMNFASSALLGFGQGFQPVCGFNYGAKKFDRVRKAFYFCVKTSFFALVAIAVIGFLFAPQIVGLFNKEDPQVVTVGALALRLQCAAFPLMGWVIMGNMMLQTIGKAGKASLLAVARQGMFLLPLIFILPGILGIQGIQFCQPIADILTFSLSMPLVRGVLKEMYTEQQRIDGQTMKTAALNASQAGQV